MAAAELLTQSTGMDTAARWGEVPARVPRRALGGVALTDVLRSPRLLAARGGGRRARVARGVSRGGGRAVRASAPRHRGRAPPARSRADTRASVAPAGSDGRCTRQPPVLRRLVHRGRHPRAVAAGARAARVEGARLARGAGPVAAARVLAHRHRREQPGPPPSLLAGRVPALRALGLAVRGRRGLALRADALSPGRDRAPPA